MTYATRYGLVGFLVGLLFPLAGMLQVAIMWDSVNLATLADMQRRVPLLWVLDCVPLVLGAMMWMTGRQRQQYEGLADLVDAHEARDAEKAEELRVHIAELEEALKAKDAMLSVVSHELRTPLTVILGYAEIVEEEATGMALESVTAIRAEGKRLLETVNALLDLARLEVGEVQLTLRPVKVGEAVTETLDSLRPLIERKGLQLRVLNRVPDTLARLDLLAVRRVITNLISNAVKFTESGLVTVILEHDVRHVMVKVRDTGRGISQGFLPRLFEPFTQEDDYLDREQEGSGLGLAIVRRLVKMMHGSIEVESELGVGTTFVLRFPIYYEDPLAVREQSVGAADGHSITADLDV